MPAGTNTGRILLPEELWNIDTKMDDSMPNSGKTVGLGTAGACTTGNSATDTYVLTNTDLACYALFITGS